MQEPEHKELANRIYDRQMKINKIEILWINRLWINLMGTPEMHMKTGFTFPWIQLVWHKFVIIIAKTMVIKSSAIFTWKSHQSLSAGSGHTWRVQAMKDV